MSDNNNILGEIMAKLNNLDAALSAAVASKARRMASGGKVGRKANPAFESCRLDNGLIRKVTLSSRSSDLVAGLYLRGKGAPGKGVEVTESVTVAWPYNAKQSAVISGFDLPMAAQDVPGSKLAMAVPRRCLRPTDDVAVTCGRLLETVGLEIAAWLVDTGTPDDTGTPGKGKGGKGVRK